MDNILLVSEVATLSQRSKRQSHEYYKKSDQWNASMNIDIIDSVGAQEDDSVSKVQTETVAEQYYGSFSTSQRQVILEHLGAWEEPEVTSKKTVSCLLSLFKSSALSSLTLPLALSARTTRQSMRFFSFARR